MGIVVIGGGGGGGTNPNRLSADGSTIETPVGDPVAVFPQTVEGRKAARAYLKMLDGEAPLGDTAT